MPQLLSFENKIRVLIADRAAMSCYFLAEALAADRRYHADAVVTEIELRQTLEARSFDILLISGSFENEGSGASTLLREIGKSWPAMKVVVLLESLDRKIVVDAFRNGASGVLSREDSFLTLCKCLSCVHQGETWAGTDLVVYVIEALSERTPIQDRNISGPRALSRREEEIAQLAATGLTNRQISEQLAISEHTVKNYLFRIFEKLGVSTRVELTLHALNLRASERAKSRFEASPAKDRWYGTS